MNEELNRIFSTLKNQLANGSEGAVSIAEAEVRHLVEQEPIHDFGWALKALKEGKNIARSGWNGKGMFLYRVKGAYLQNILKYGYGEYNGEPVIVDTIAMKTAQNTIVIGWLASQSDLFATDWTIVQ